MRSIALAAAVVIACASHAVAKPDETAIPYPTGYRNWVHVKSQVITSASPAFEHSGGIHHIYANPKAMEGYRKGKFPDGSVIVADFLHAKDADGMTDEAARRRIDVMVKNSKRFSATGGWGFEQFKGDSKTDRTSPDQATCFSCHSKQRSNDFVLSRFRN